MIRSVSLSGCGWLIPYHVGVLKCLVERGIVCKDRTVLSGVSGGAIVAAGLASNIDLNDVSRLMREGADRIRNTMNGRFVGNMRHVLEEMLDDVLPSNAHEMASHRVKIGVLTPRLHCKVVSEFDSKKDLIHACLASSHIPFYMDGQIFCHWRNKRWLDGGLLDILPPSYAENEIKSLPYSIMAKLRPDREQIVTPNTKTFNLFRELLPYTFIPPDDNGEWFSRLEKSGMEDAEAYLLDRSQAF